MTDAIGTLTKRVLFSPLNDSGRTETVVDRIRSAIMLGIFADGEQLPNEIDLAAQFQVSPVTLRDALRVVRQEGLARTTRGRSGGTFVIAPDESNMGQFEQRLAMASTLELRELFDWQTALSAHGARLAAERASATESMVLMSVVEQFGLATEAPLARRILSRLLIEISAASRSARLTREVITQLIDVAPHAMLVLRDSATRSACFHYGAAIVGAIREQDQEQAGTQAVNFVGFLGDHVLELRHALTRHLPEQRGEKHV